MLIKKIFFDADTLIAGSASQTGASFLLIQLCGTRILSGMTCRQLVTECRRNLKKKLPQAEAIFDEIVQRALEIKKIQPLLSKTNIVIWPTPKIYPF